MITSAANPRIKEARKLQRRRYRHEQRRLLLEGVRLVGDALDAGYLPQEVFVAPEMVASNPAALALVDRLAGGGVNVQEVTPAVFALLADTVTPQGIAAVVPLPSLPLPSLPLPGAALPEGAPPAAPRLSLILDRVRDPGNAGTLLRSAEAAGADCALFAPETVDPYNDKVVRAAMGAHFRLPLRVCATWQEVVAHLAPDQRLYVAEAAAAQSYEEVDWTQPAALVVGGEAEGASPAGRAAAQALSIPMAGGTESLNAAVAGAVMLFEAARQRRLSKKVAGQWQVR